jgi:hypothetical protein
MPEFFVCQILRSMSWHSMQAKKLKSGYRLGCMKGDGCQQAIRVVGFHSGGQRQGAGGQQLVR